MCPQEWTALNYGWWTQLKPYFRQSFKDQGDKEQAKARAEQIAETKRLATQIDKIRTGGK